MSDKLAKPPPDVWLRGAVNGVAPVLMPVAHSFLQAIEEIGRSGVLDLSPAQLWTRPGGAAAAGFHLRHLAGATDRLLTYARGEPLTEAQKKLLGEEGSPGEPPADAATLVRETTAAFNRALEQVRATPAASLDDERRIGKAGLSTSVRGLLFHAAEHAYRHAGQLITTVKVLRS